MINVALLHPFSAQAIGLKETDLYHFHSKPHENALKHLKEYQIDSKIDYFTAKPCYYTKKVNSSIKRFWPITFPYFKHKHTWRRQKSFWHYAYYYINCPEITIINMSGHGSKYVFKLAKLISKKNKHYIPMIGGLHMSTDGAALNYYKNANHIIVHTQIQKNKLQKISGFENVLIEVLPLGVNIEVFKPIVNTDPKVKLLVVGRISRLKQIELAIQALNLLKEQGFEDSELTIIGPESDSEYLQELKRLVQNLNLKENVHFLGTLIQEQLIPYYQEASLLLMPSNHESFGMVMVESLACGTPIIALQGSGGPDEIVENGKNGFLCEPKNFSKMVVSCLKSPNRLKNLRKHARQTAIDKWSLNHTTQCLLKSLQHIIKNDVS